jgi:hypothetical protein
VRRLRWLRRLARRVWHPDGQVSVLPDGSLLSILIHDLKDYIMTKVVLLVVLDRFPNSFL